MKYKKIYHLLIALFIMLILHITSPFYSRGNALSSTDPLSVAKLIGDKLIRETPFAYRLEIATDNKVFKLLHEQAFLRKRYTWFIRLTICCHRGE
jgi:hypothetical protein